MTIDERVKCLVKTGRILESILLTTNESNLISTSEKKLFSSISSVQYKNSWFSEWSVRNALEGIVKMLGEKDLLEFLASYYKPLLKKDKVYNVGLVMAGNIPLVGFHDFVCVFLAGDTAKIKLSSEDDVLFPLIFDLMKEINPKVGNSCVIQETKLSDIDRVIATGSSNTARYFEYYFSKYPNVIRKSRTSVGIVNKEDTDDDFLSLANDLFYYYGMGCRNVSKLYFPQGFDVVHFIDVLRTYDNQLDNTKYINNLDYNKSIMLINSTPFLDAGFFFLKEDESLFSPVSIIHYEFYDDKQKVYDFIKENEHSIQCVVSSQNEYGVKLGQAQFPKLWDYADNVDVMAFLLAD